ncbi:MAG: hypothetical protein ACYTBP_07640 [Planctomycetota bacterium]|jgi:hypothetical protein
MLIPVGNVIVTLSGTSQFQARFGKAGARVRAAWWFGSMAEEDGRANEGTTSGNGRRMGCSGVQDH